VGDEVEEVSLDVEQAVFLRVDLALEVVADQFLELVEDLCVLPTSRAVDLQGVDPGQHSASLDADQRFDERVDQFVQLFVQLVERLVFRVRGGCPVREVHGLVQFHQSRDALKRTTLALFAFLDFNVFGCRYGPIAGLCVLLLDVGVENARNSHAVSLPKHKGCAPKDTPLFLRVPQSDDYSPY
jgi:hypothetical protein